jgi:hypothetical protein
VTQFIVSTQPESAFIDGFHISVRTCRRGVRDRIQPPDREPLACVATVDVASSW